ncbi:MAG: hypothetical protein IPL77_11360 [Flavobacteriales bacterium]|nr:hypothetical protein [Flavobacteriales bacterium]
MPARVTAVFQVLREQLHLHLLGDLLDFPGTVNEDRHPPRAEVTGDLAGGNPDDARPQRVEVALGYLVQGKPVEKFEDSDGRQPGV